MAGGCACVGDSGGKSVRNVAVVVGKGELSYEAGENCVQEREDLSWGK